MRFHFLALLKLLRSKDVEKLGRSQAQTKKLENWTEKSLKSIFYTFILSYTWECSFMKEQRGKGTVGESDKDTKGQDSKWAQSAKKLDKKL